MRFGHVVLSGIAAMLIVGSPALAQEHPLDAAYRSSAGPAKVQSASFSAKQVRVKVRAAGYSRPAASSGGKSSTAPLAYQLFCLQNPEQCRGGGKSTAHASKSMMSKLNSVNRSVNRSIAPRSEFGRRDQWNVNARSGDCEDYALTKRARLIQMGVPASALRLAVARTRAGEGHAVLVVKTDSGDFVLDNRTSAIKKWHQTDLTLIRVASANPLQWSTSMR